eukprot:3212775-Pyramimonas_sp.AAC.1
MPPARKGPSSGSRWVAKGSAEAPPWLLSLQSRPSEHEPSKVRADFLGLRRAQSGSPHLQY